MKNFDIIIIGAGPNGLSAASYLSKSGKKVLVVEKSPEYLWPKLKNFWIK